MSLMGTTIVAVRRDGKCAVAGDGQVTMGEKTVMKAHAKKVRRLYHNRVVVGFAGSVADAFSLSERFEAKLEQYSGSLRRAAVSLAQDWRSDKAMRQLEAMLIAAAACMRSRRQRHSRKILSLRRQKSQKRRFASHLISAYSQTETSPWRKFKC